MRQQRGHFILVGVGGSGKKSLSELGAVLSSARLMKIEPQKKYGKKEFRIDIFNIMVASASSNAHVMFLFPDTDIIQEGYLFNPLLL
jgi:dynein heavy chain